ncbi:ArsI/CadI family heavy metal resistance metalloenzyme [Knoellia aerolata]|uniref:ArsI/CadI family heavy metal resistance metalloenzyme n=1 Tax=Knoellia aerolata TaxID=442954 RepID=UPI0009FCEEFD|nr:ArsI/CadI family heavy metal resistance metalloenzyme [Knoellia aerolata]
MSRVQLALRVADLDASIEFYSRLFDTTPAKRRPGYANFAIAEPPLKLVLLEGQPGEDTRMDHLGVEVESTDRVTSATTRLAEAGLATRVEDNTTCCYAVQDKVWVTGPGSEPWEVYTVTGDARPDLEGKTSLDLSDVAGDGTCCATDSTTDTTTDNPIHDVAVAETQTAAACC